MLSAAGEEPLSIGELLQLRENIGTKKFAQLQDDSSASVKPEIGKRAHKKRPREVTSKKKVSVLRNLEGAKQRTRDPRFDDLSGSYNEEVFKHSYDFVNDIRAEELTKLKGDIKKCKNEKRKAELVSVINRLSNEEKTRQTKLNRQLLKSESRKSALKNVQEGKNPYFAKRSELRKAELQDKFTHLKKEGKLEKYIEKKRKKNLQKDKKLL